MNRWSFIVLVVLLGLGEIASGAESWEAALEQMPLGVNVLELNRTNCVKLMLAAFQSNHIVKALIFMPGATDEFYMFRRAKAQLTNNSPSLLDAVEALTNQTLIRATFRPPFVLLHSDEDPLEPLATIEHEGTAAKLRAGRFVSHAVYDDRDWDFLQPILVNTLKADVRPWRYNYDSWHFYRHSFAAWNLTGWEALEAVALAGKSQFTVQRKAAPAFMRTLIQFKEDERVRQVPKP